MLLDDDPLVKMEIWFGHVELRSWIEYDAVRERFIGMGEARHYDKDGLLVSCSRGPTGMEAWFEDPPLPWWQRLLGILKR
jgi:hypothetical protein